MDQGIDAQCGDNADKHTAKSARLTWRRPWRVLVVGLYYLTQISINLAWALYLRAGGRRPAKWDTQRKELLYLICDQDFWSGDQFSYGGHVAHIRGVIQALAQDGYRVHLVTNQAQPRIDHPNVIRHLVQFQGRVPEAPILNQFAFNRRLTRVALDVAARNRIGFVYQRHSMLAFSGAAVARCLGVPLFLEVNSPLSLLEKGVAGRMLLVRFFETTAFALAQRIGVVSDMARELLMQADPRVKAADVLANPNGVDARMFAPEAARPGLRHEHGIAQDAFVVGFSGAFSFWHGIETLIEAFCDFAAERPGARLAMLGSGGERAKYEAKLDERGMLDRATFFGVVPFEQVPSHLACCDALVSPQVPFIGKTFHGSPIKLFEYMAMGKPVVASDIGQLAQVVRHEHSGLLFEPGNAGQLARCFQRLYNDPQLARRLGANARQEVLQYYTWERNARRIIEALRDCNDN
ncbi:MAG: glycosyltransferase family 4 protein [Candidatus Alcyoniella australis]|nr:glycosyltransferase family 4 protein [Candidatus Alcyoniella australis]